MADELIPIQFPYHDIAFKVALAAGIGLLVGLEREWSHKESGVRTFALSGLLGMLTSLVAPLYVVSALLAIVLMIAFLNVQSLLKDRSLELTTSLCLVVVFFLGTLVGQGHYFAAATAAIVVMFLLSWKSEFERFAGALRHEEIRSAVLFGLFSVVIYPLLPNRFVDSWNLVNPREAWVMVMVIAGIGFLNYVLLRLYSEKGLYYAAVLGAMVNSTAAVSELSAMLGAGHRSAKKAASVLQLTNVSMSVRNALILGIFAPRALIGAAVPLSLMGLMAAVLGWSRNDSGGPAEPLHLTSPVSLRRVLKFGIIFLALSCAGTLAQRHLGNLGLLAVSVAGGMVSSASTTATAAALASAGVVGFETAAIATVLTSLSSAAINVPVVYQQTRRMDLVRRFGFRTLLVILAALSGLLAENWIRHGQRRHFGREILMPVDVIWIKMKK